MADDQIQRPHSSHETLARSTPARAPAPSSGSDPLAELARLIGQTDPFSEHGQRRPAAPQPTASANWAPPPLGGNGFAPPPVAHVPPAQPYGAQNFGRQPYGSAPLAPTGNRYPPAHDPAVDQDTGYEDEVAYHQNKPDLAPEEADFYEDEHSGRRRLGVMVVAGVFALAVIGAAGAYGYRALFGSSGTSGPPPVIKADSGPSKIVPASNNTQSNKQINDRVNDRGMGEKLVSREEQPVDIKDKSAGVISQSSAPPLGTGIVGSEPKRVRTIAIHPDQSAAADATPVSAPPTAPARTTVVAPSPPPVRQVTAPPPRVVSNSPPPAADPEPAPAPAPRQAAPAARAAPPAPQAAAPASGNAPLSLSPDAAPARAAAPAARASAPPPARTAAVAPTPAAPAAAAGGAAGSFAVQVSSQRSEAEAQAAFRDLQGKFPGQLGGKQPLIRQVDLGEKGIYFRAMVGPFANGSDAVALCSSLKAAGGSCIIQKN